MTLRGVLKHETEGQHARLDTALSALNLAEASDYGRFLRLHGAVLPPLERQLEQAGVAALVADWPRRQRRALLAADLSVLRLSLPTPVEMAPLSGADEMLGALYVLEGARLGHAMLLRHLPEDAPTRAATAFLAHGVGERLWGGFLAVLAEREGIGADRERMVAAAHRTFAAYEQAAEVILSAAPAAMPSPPPPVRALDRVS